MSMYDILAPVYDAFNGDIDYEPWADYIEKLFKKYGRRKTNSILDLGCGTGKMTLALARRGYDMIGVDLSEEMLARGRENAAAERLEREILWLCQDMTAFELYGTVDAVICCLDGVNHLQTPADLKKMLRLAFNYLEADGLLLFDVNTLYKFRAVYGDRTYVFDEEDSFCTWQNDYNEKSKLCDFYITLFRRLPDGTYAREDDWQRERYYPIASLQKLLAECGFELLEAVGNFEGETLKDADERCYIAARAVKKKGDPNT